MSMLSRWTIGAMASKKASASLPVAAAMASARRGGGQRAGGDDRRAAGGKRVDPLAHDVDVGMRGDAARHFGGEGLAVDRERRTGGHAVEVGGGHDERSERAHFLVEQADGIGLGIVGAEAVRADHFGEPVAVVRRAWCRRHRAFR